MSKVLQEEKIRFRSSFGATILFSGVQFYQILIRIVKSKFVALFIGPAGMGIMSLLHTTAELVSSATNLGLKTSGVKTIAAAKSQNNLENISKTIVVLRRLILITGIIGTLVCALLSPLWSQMSFGNDEYIWAFVFVSLIILFEQLNNGELVLLQGLRKKKSLAKANLIGQTLSLFLTVPLYYFYGIKAIVWVLVLSAFITLCISRIYTYQLHVPKARVSWAETFSIGREMVTLGVFLSLQYLLSHIVVYLIRNFVSNHGGIEQVGLYSAGTSIITSYLGLVFSAIATDYFPRLAATKGNDELKTAIHTQAEISMLLFAPLIVAFVIFIKPIIVLLYSGKFLPIEGMLYWAMGATLIKAMGWAASFSLLAKAKSSLFFLNEVIAKFYTVPLALIGYQVWGLTGFGMATFISYSIYLLQVLVLSKKLFDFQYNCYIWRLFIILNIPIALSVMIKLAMPQTWSYMTGVIVLVVTLCYVYKILNRKMDIRSIVSKIMNKRNG